MRSSLDDAARSLKVGRFDVPGRIEALLAQSASLEKELDAVRASQRSDVASELASGAAKHGDFQLVVAEVDLGGNEMRQLALAVRDRSESPVAVILGSSSGGKGAIVGVLSRELVDRGISAAELIRGGAAEMGGGGSRDPELAQAGGPHGERIGAALDLARAAAIKALSEL